MSDLCTRIQNLPAELFNKIYNLTFTASQASRTIDKSYTPPSSLHVSRQTRSRFALSFFNNDRHSPFYISKDVAGRFLGSLEGKHRIFINSIGLVGAETDVSKIPIVVPADVPGCIELFEMLRDKAVLNVLYMTDSETCAIKVSGEGRIRWTNFTQLLELRDLGWRFQVP